MNILKKSTLTEDYKETETDDRYNRSITIRKVCEAIKKTETGKNDWIRWVTSFFL